jgi:indolepyruvate ferredoxin oxidoreductase alpha subunit
MKGLDVLVAALRRSADTFYAVPGYPVTEIAAALDAELVVNEKVGVEYALGDSLSGRRAAVILKNVGLNACADPLVNATTQGLKAGFVVVAGDDVEVLGSQNAQDSRYYGEIAQIPVIEPDSETMGSAIEEAFTASEKFSRAALLRITPAALSGTAVATLADRGTGEGSLADPKLTMKGRTAAADRLTARMFTWSQSSPLNRMRGGIAGVGAAEGISAVVTVYPPPAPSDELADTAEYGRPFVREHRCAIPPAATSRPETFNHRGYYRTFCRGCPFIPLITMMKEKGLGAICDIGCSLLAQNPPYGVGVASYGLGSSVAVAARSTKVALIGDYAMLHSGINALADACEKGLPLLCIILKNEKMGMTGGHPTPDILKYISWAHPHILDAGDGHAIEQELAIPNEPCVVVIRGTCPKGAEHETVEC